MFVFRANHHSPLQIDCFNAPQNLPPWVIEGVFCYSRQKTLSLQVNMQCFVTTRAIMKKFNEYDHFDLSEINHQVLEEWEKQGLFHRSIDEREGCPTFIFYEGPPSANGMPGIHHVMARTIKDTFCRYKTMRGYQVRRKAGWDTHGLPVELGVEKMLGITKEDIGKKISVDEYNAACRREVMKYTKEWTALTKKMGYWVDLENPYITYDNKYMETLWWLLKQLYNKGLLYKGYTIQPYSPAAGTGLSSHELNQPGCYRDVKDTTCTAQFHIKGDRWGSDAYFIAWTTTPWTLPSNTALCVGPNIDYVAVRGENPYSKQAATYILAASCLASYAKELGEQPEPLWRGKGSELVGTEYEQLIPWANPGEGAFRVIAGDYVTTDEGTGIVHIAPTFGADDAFVAKKADVPGMTFVTKNGEIRPMVDMTGKFFVVDDLDPEFVRTHINTELYNEFAGRFVKNAYDPNLTDKDETLDIAICMMLKRQGLVFRIEKHTHSYPHCWRTDKPVIYYPLDSWFVKTTAVKDEMIALNKTINWKPESTGSGRFGKWLENLNDWNLSRSRYWGTPLPIWRTDDGREEICIGSIEELFAEIEKSVAAGVMDKNPWPNFRVGDYSKENYDPKNIDLHRPYIDGVVLVSPSGKPMHREPDLIDVWFDSGSMPYAQIHFPFEQTPNPQGGFKEGTDFSENIKMEGSMFPADFISEGVDQTRGWFFTLHAIATMVFHSVAFKNVVSNGLVLDKNGNKMSKRLGNAVDPFSTIEKYGSDPVRWYMMTNSSPWDNLKFDNEGVEEVRRKFFGTLYNTYSFFALYANVDGFTGSEKMVPLAERPEIDRWILSLLNTLVSEVTAHYESYEPTRAGRAISDFVQENLSNWYVRLNRKRFWGGTMDADKLAAYQTLYECLTTVSRLMAPIAPFYADRLYRDLTGADSVHLASFPEVDNSREDKRLEGCMQLAQQTTSMILALRKKANKKVRQPLQKAVVPVPDATAKEELLYVADLVKTEVNVKELQVVLSDESEIRLVKRAKANFKTLGKRYGKQMKEIAAAIATLPQDQIAALECDGQLALPLPSGEVLLELADVEIATEDMPGWLVANEGALTVALDIEMTDALLNEGVARELVNRIQNLRKSNGYEITDKIAVQIENRAEIAKAVTDYHDYIASQVLATSLTLVDSLTDATDLDFEDFVVKVKVVRN